MPFGKRQSKINERVSYLRQHPELWRNIQLTGEAGMRVVCRGKADHIRIAKALKQAGLYAPTTYVMDIQVGELIHLVQKEQTT